MTSPSTKEGGANRPWDAIEADFVGAIGVGSDPQSLPLSSVEIAFAGRSNVGKSSLINALVRRRGLVRTSNTPGCTRQINFFSVACRDGARSVFVDLPGYGFAKRSKAEKQQWAQLIEGYLAKRPSLSAVVLLVDARRGVEEEEIALLEFIAEHRSKPPIPVLLVATKFDKVERSRSKVVRDELRRRAGVPVVAFSTVDKVGYDELWKAIRKATGVGEARTDDSSVPATKPA